MTAIRRTRTLVVGAAAVLALAACGSDEADTSATSASVATTVAAATTSVATSAAATTMAATTATTAAAATTAPAPASTATPMTTAAAASTVAAATTVAGGGGAMSPAATVAIGDFVFQPATVDVSVGGTVTWMNEHTQPHTATGAGKFDTGSLAPGASMAITFDTAGTYAYICSFHPFMTGTVNVA